MLRAVIVVILFVASVVGINALEQDTISTSQPLRPVTSAYMLETGSSNITDTYLTPLKYDGFDVAFQYERWQAMKFDPENWTMLLTAGIELHKTDNPARNATMWYLGANASWGMTHRWQLPQHITLAAGGSTGIDIGCLYNSRNGNNPASAKAAWTINLTGYATWNVTIGRLPITLRYQPTIPITGVFFSPDYGELYYEIYLGTNSGLAHMAWWGNYFKMVNLLTADLHLGNTSLRLGYRNNILSTKVNDITTRMINHNFIIGVSGEWLSMSRRPHLDTTAKIISALY